MSHPFLSKKSFKDIFFFSQISVLFLVSGYKNTMNFEKMLNAPRDYALF